MSTATIKQNIIYGIGEGASVAATTMLEYSLRWANAAYRELFSRHQFRHIRKRVAFRTADGQETYQAPSDFIGFVTLKDESNDQIIGQVTPEELTRDTSPVKITDEEFDADDDTAVSLDYTGIVQFSETVTNAAGTTTYVRDTDYTMVYADGTITVDSTGSMVDGTTYEIDYLYRPTAKPTQFCIEYSPTNSKYVFRFDPVPDGIYVVSLIHEAMPSVLSASVDTIWSRLEYAIERGGVFFGSLEMLDGKDPKIDRFERKWEQAILALVRLDNDLVPKHDRIKVVMKKQDY